MHAVGQVVCLEIGIVDRIGKLGGRGVKVGLPISRKGGGVSLQPLMIMLADCEITLRADGIESIHAVGKRTVKAAVANIRLIGSQAGKITDEICLVLPHKAAGVSKLMPDGEGELRIRHMYIDVCLSGVGKIKAGEIEA